jgi:hypothetical protein
LLCCQLPLLLRLYDIDLTVVYPVTVAGSLKYPVQDIVNGLLFNVKVDQSVFIEVSLIIKKDILALLLYCLESFLHTLVLQFQRQKRVLRVGAGSKGKPYCTKKEEC